MQIFEQMRVAGSPQLLLRDGLHIVPGLGNEPGSPRTEVLIQLEFHAALCLLAALGLFGPLATPWPLFGLWSLSRGALSGRLPSGV